METVAYEELRQRREEWDEAVRVTPDIDHFCSASPWVFSAHQGLMGRRRAWVIKSGGGWAGLAFGEHPAHGIYLEPLEALWGFACPFVGPDPGAVAAEVLALLRGVPDWQLLLASGLGPRSPLLLRFAQEGLKVGQLGVAGVTTRLRARLDGGLDGYLSRRTGGFRRNLARARRKADAAGVVYTVVDDVGADDVDALWQRVLEVELRSWKGEDGVGIESGRMKAFYELMLPMLACGGSLRLVFASIDGVDVAYHFGGVWGDLYRGLQQSFDNRFRHLSLGTLTHARMVEAVCREGCRLYDLGQAIGYKERWSESSMTTVTLAIVRDGRQERAR
jgi:hypothetical protein